MQKIASCQERRLQVGGKRLAPESATQIQPNPFVTFVKASMGNSRVRVFISLQELFLAKKVIGPQERYDTARAKMVSLIDK